MRARGRVGQGLDGVRGAVAGRACALGGTGELCCKHLIPRRESMSRSIRSGAIVVALLALAACSESPVQSTDASSPAPALAIAVQRAPEQVVGGDVVVKFRRGVDVDAALSAHGLARGEAGYRGAFVVARGLVGNEHANARALRA